MVRTEVIEMFKLRDREIDDLKQEQEKMMLTKSTHIHVDFRIVIGSPVFI